MDLSSVVIITTRLKISPVTKQYIQNIFDETTPDITKYLTFDNSGNIQDTEKFISESKIKIEAKTDLIVTMVTIITGDFIGCAGIHNINTSHPELGIWIKKSAQRKGFGRETIKALIDWMKANLIYEYISYPVSKENIASRKLIESFGGVIKAERLFTSPTGKILDEAEYRLFP
ncbi:acetyltransferase [sediment metagenome]|uniref:Acetyltransferase n=1 Tax=sediment metagenome TaxID=749907 RepID=D9PKX0_9ZZZZ